MAFLSAVREDTDCYAVRLASEAIEQGETIEELFLNDEEFGFSLGVRPLSIDRFMIELGCQPGPMVGDGGEWEVVYRPDGAIDSVTLGEFWIS